MPDDAQKIAFESQPPRGDEVSGVPLVLIVDDHQTVRVLLSAVLATAGHATVVARDGTEGFATWQNERGRIRVVITDIEMPGMSGPEMAEAIWHQSPGVPVIYVTGLGTHDKAAEHVRHRNAYYLHKPFLPHALLALLDVARRQNDCDRH